MIKPWGVTCIQPIIRVVTDKKSRDQRIRENLSRNMEIIDMLCVDARYKSKVVVFPEFFLTSVPESRKHEEYMMRSIYVPGKETEIMSAKAREHGLYIVGNVFELDDQWPDRCFNTSFIIDPKGNVALKYRKVNDTQIYSPTNTNTGDVYSRFVEMYGEDALFPVLDTPLGRLSCLTCYDINFPEVARILSLKGAEVIFMPTGDGYGWAKRHAIMRQARAMENMVYIVSVTHGKFMYGARPEHQQAGNSGITDFAGNITDIADGPGELTISGIIDIQSLRERRAMLNHFNYLVGFRGTLYAKYYEKAPTWPLDNWLEKPMRSNQEALELGQKILEGLYEKGIYVRP